MAGNFLPVDLSFLELARDAWNGGYRVVGNRLNDVLREKAPSELIDVEQLRAGDSLRHAAGTLRQVLPWLRTKCLIPASDSEVPAWTLGFINWTNNPRVDMSVSGVTGNIEADLDFHCKFLRESRDHWTAEVWRECIKLPVESMHAARLAMLDQIEVRVRGLDVPTAATLRDATRLATQCVQCVATVLDDAARDAQYDRALSDLIELTHRMESARDIVEQAADNLRVLNETVPSILGQSAQSYHELAVNVAAEFYKLVWYATQRIEQPDATFKDHVGKPVRIDHGAFKMAWDAIKRQMMAADSMFHIETTWLINAVKNESAVALAECERALPRAEGRPPAYANYDRDKLIYESRVTGKTWKEIGTLLRQRPEWDSLTEAGIRNAAKIYAERCRVPPPPRGKSGRPATAK